MPSRLEAFRRHAYYYRDLALRAEPALLGPEQGSWLARLAAEYGNLRAALEWAASQDPVAVGLPLATALHRFWEVRGPLREGSRWVKTLLQHAPTPSVLRAKGLYVAGALAIRLGEAEEKTRFLHESIDLFRILGEDYGLARALTALGGGTPLPNGRPYYEEALCIWRHLGYEEGIASALNNLGNVAWAEGRPDQAQALYEESLRLKRRIGARQTMTNTLNNLGDIALAKRDMKTARQWYQESLGIARELGSRPTIAVVLSYLGDIALVAGDAAAQGYYEQSWEEWRTLPERVTVPLPLIGLAKLALRRGQLHEAEDYLRESLNALENLSDQAGIRHALIGFAGVAAMRGDNACAAALLGAGEAQESSLRPVDEADYEQCLATARSTLGAARFSAAWTRGHGMSAEEAVRFALAMAGSAPH